MYMLSLLFFNEQETFFHLVIVVHSEFSFRERFLILFDELFKDNGKRVIDEKIL